MNKTLIILSHPSLENSKFNKALIEGIGDLENITVHHLEAKYGTDIKSFDVEAEQQLLLEHDRIIFQFPFYWYSTPAMLKAYQDEVLTYGFAFGSDGDKLHGKQFKVVTTTGGTDYAYQAGGWNNFSMSTLLKPIQQTANLTGMIYTRAFILHGVLVMTDEELEKNINDYKEVLLDQEWDNGLTKYLNKMDDSSLT